MAYVYRHIRLDKNIPFYIGIGSDSDGKYKRAFNTISRNNKWKNTVSKCGEYRVEILFDDIDIEYALQKEIEFIALYGRESLCNLTDGGEGCSGRVATDATREALRRANTGKKLSLETKKKLSDINKNKKIPAAFTEAAATYWIGKKRSKEFGENLSKIKTGIKYSESSKAKMKRVWANRSQEKKDQITATNSKPIGVFSSQTNDLIFKFKSLSEASRQMNLSLTYIFRRLNGMVKTQGEYQFRYLEKK